MLLEGPHEKPFEKLVNIGILEGVFPYYVDSFEAGRRNEFGIDVNALSRIEHLFIVLRNIPWIEWMHHYNALLSKRAVKAGEQAEIAAHPRFDPEKIGKNPNCGGVYRE